MYTGLITESKMETECGPVMLDCKINPDGSLLPLGALYDYHERHKEIHRLLKDDVKKLLIVTNYKIVKTFSVHSDEVYYSCYDGNEIIVKNANIGMLIGFFLRYYRDNVGKEINVTIKIYLVRQIKNDCEIFGTQFKIRVGLDRCKDIIQNVEHKVWSIYIESERIQLETGISRAKEQNIYNEILNRIHEDYLLGYDYSI